MTRSYLRCAHGKWIDDHCPECEKVFALVERLQERIKLLITERNALQAEVQRLDPTGVVRRRMESDLIQWKRSYERTKAQRDVQAALLKEAESTIHNLLPYMFVSDEELAMNEAKTAQEINRRIRQELATLEDR